MPNPALLFLDSDVLIQLLLADPNLAILRALKSEYDISAAIVPEVEIEIDFNRKFAGECDVTLRKSIANHIVSIVHADSYGDIVSARTGLAAIAARTSYSDIQALGSQYHRRIDRGEAYTHAMAITLEQPAASNDWHAIQVVQNAGLRLPSPVLRTFDLIVFALEASILTLTECEDLRQTLIARREHVPKAFRNSSVKNGIRHFESRLLNCSPTRGREGVQDFERQLVIGRIPPSSTAEG